MATTTRFSPKSDGRSRGVSGQRRLGLTNRVGEESAENDRVLGRLDLRGPPRGGEEGL